MPVFRPRLLAGEEFGAVSNAGQGRPGLARPLDPWPRPARGSPPWPTRAFRLIVALVLVGAYVAGPVPAAAAPSTSGGVGTSAPADLTRSLQWPLTALHIRQAWRYSRGKGVTVAVLDTGVDGRHPDLTGSVVNGPDYTGTSRGPGSRYWGRHGTAMASLIAGHGHGSDSASGIIGVAPQAGILSVRVTWEVDDPARHNRSGTGHNRDAIAEGIRYAVDNGAQIINMSLGGGKQLYDGSRDEQEAVEYALDKGVVLIAAAGNDGAGANRRNFPAAYRGVIAVGAVDRTMKPAKFTTRHDYVTVAAPGVDIVYADSDQGYLIASGTSPSAALVAGIVALIRSRYPRLTPEQVRLALQQGVTHPPAAGRTTAMGTGVTDAVRALFSAAKINKAANRDATKPPPVEPPPQSEFLDEGLSPIIIGMAVLGGALLLLVIVVAFRGRLGGPRDQVPWTPPVAPPQPMPQPMPVPPRRGPLPAQRPPPAHMTGFPAHGPPPDAPIHVPPWQSDEVLPAPVTNDDRRDAWTPRGRGDTSPPAPASLRPYDVLAASSEVRNGVNGNGQGAHAFPAATAEFGAPPHQDPLGSSAPPAMDIGTPLADQSWNTVRRGREQLDEPLADLESSQDDPAGTMNLPVIPPGDAFADPGEMPPGLSNDPLTNDPLTDGPEWLRDDGEGGSSGPALSR